MGYKVSGKRSGPPPKRGPNPHVPPIKMRYGGGADMGDPGRAQERADRGYGSTAGPDRSRTTAAQDANQRAVVRAGRVRDVENLIDRPTFGFNDAARINLFNPGNILGGILGLINPALGLGFRAFNYLKDEIPETFNQFKDSATLEEFRDKVRGYGRTMPTVSPNPMYGGIESLAVNPQTVSVNPQITRDLLAFNPGSVKDRALKQQYGIYNATGMMNPNMIDLMKQDIELNKQKGTPLSLPAEAYSLIG